MFAPPKGDTQGVSSPKQRGAKKASEDGSVEKKGYVREMIDIGALCLKAWPIFYARHGYCKRCNPLDAFVLILLLTGCDYVKKPNFIVFKDILAAYLLHNKGVGCVCPRDPKGILFRIDYSAFLRLLSAAYATKNKLKLPDPYNYGAVLSKLRATKEAADQEKARKAANSGPRPLSNRKPIDRLPPANPLGLCGRLCFTTNHYLRTQHMQLINGLFNGLEKDKSTGKSLYGYTMDQNDKCAFTDDVVRRDVF